MKRERGFALPIVVAIFMLLVVTSFFLLSALVRHHQINRLQSETLQAQYAAESGIALMQQRLKKYPTQQQPLYYQWDDYYVTTKLVKSDTQIEIQSQALGKRGIRQTIFVKLDPTTLAIREWLK